MKRIYDYTQGAHYYSLDLKNDRFEKIRSGRTYEVVIINDKDDEISYEIFQDCTKNDLNKIVKMIDKYSNKGNCEKLQDSFDSKWFSGSFTLCITHNNFTIHKQIID